MNVQFSVSIGPDYNPTQDFKQVIDVIKQENGEATFRNIIFLFPDKMNIDQLFPSYFFTTAARRLLVTMQSTIYILFIEDIEGHCTDYFREQNIGSIEFDIYTQPETGGTVEFKWINDITEIMSDVMSNKKWIKLYRKEKKAKAKDPVSKAGDTTDNEDSDYDSSNDPDAPDDGKNKPGKPGVKKPKPKKPAPRKYQKSTNTFLISTVNECQSFLCTFV